ncbi:MAG TPA: hypothetical protein VEW05_09285 [Candidatus Polarisedimenticolia bacterium]|nr:hypothetical protein [Candidatus Polarisedimenticolia bacterium]
MTKLVPNVIAAPAISLYLSPVERPIGYGKTALWELLGLYLTLVVAMCLTTISQWSPDSGRMTGNSDLTVAALL